MGFFAEFMPFYPKSAPGKRRKPSKLDIDRALDVELHLNPTVEMRRADTGEMVLRVQRRQHPAERVFARFLGSTRHRQLVLDQYGEFLVTEGVQPGVRLSAVANAMAARFDLPLDTVQLGIIEVVKELMLKEFVFLVRAP